MRKYKYTIDDLGEQLVISHNIHLTDEDIQTIQKEGNLIEVIGTCLVTKGKNTEEIFCRYRLAKKETNKPIINASDGYWLFLKNTKDIADKEFVALTIHDIINFDISYPVIHQVMIARMKELEESLYHLSPK